MVNVKDVLENAEKICGRFTKPGAFLTAGAGSETNVMTIGWGFIGYAWQKPICAVMVRDSRFTQHLMDEHREFTVSIPFSGMERQLGKAGSLSGKDGDKWNSCGLERAEAKTISTPAVAMQDGMVFECRTVASTDLRDGFVHPAIMESIYADNDTHKIYYGEIVEAY